MPPSFFLKLTRTKGHTYARLARSIRDGHTVRTEIIQNFGRVAPSQIEGLRQWLS